MSTRFFAASAAVIWVVVKLPQEYWIHIARLDATDELKATVLRAAPEVGWGQAISQRPLAFVFLIACGAALIAAGLILIRRLLGPLVATGPAVWGLSPFTPRTGLPAAPGEAIDCFRRTRMDVLAIGSYLVLKTEN